MWSSVKLPSCFRADANCNTTSTVKTVIVPDSITTWQITGISLSRFHGICVADPLEVTVQKEFYLDVLLPSTAVRGEQLEIKVLVNNYSPTPVTVRLDVFESDNVCSKAYEHGAYRQIIKVGPQTTRSVPFSIVPMKEGRHEIMVKAAVRNSELTAGIVKTLLVKPEGVLKKYYTIIKLDPAEKGVGGQQQVIISSRITQVEFLPNTPVSTQISVTGELIHSHVENPISGNSMAAPIRPPSGSGEDSIDSMSMTVIATMYLDTTNQWETVLFRRRDDAIQFIRAGYQKSYEYFAGLETFQSSTWLTAYIAKIFTMASHLVPVQTSHICDAVAFLIFNAQRSNGMFREVGKVFNTHMMSDVQGADGDASMTAFCLIAMQESHKICGAAVDSLTVSINRAVSYLQTRLSALTNPYAVAMTSYALASENKLNWETVSKFFSPDVSHWPVPKGHVYTLEATAYVLLALVRNQAFEEASLVVRWLSQQEKVDGGYGSPQATLMVYQALAGYWNEGPVYDLDVNIFLPNRLTPLRYNFNRNNYYITRTATQFDRLTDDVTVIASGRGGATLKMVSTYYSLPDKQTECQKFNVTVQLLPDETGQDEKTYKLRIYVLYMNEEHDANLTVVDVGLLSGFTANIHDLNLLSKGHSTVNYELETVLSERGSVTVYLNKVSHTLPEEITFRIHQTFDVALLQPAAVSVYEYHNSQTPCVKPYIPERKGEQLKRLCVSDECICVEESCNSPKKDISDVQRSAAACNTAKNGITIDYAYKVRVEEFTEGLSADIYRMRVLSVIKEVTSDIVTPNMLRKFYSLPLCRDSLSLRRGKSYLIMGSSSDIHKYSNDQCWYVLRGTMWIEYWPTEAECQTGEHRPICLGLAELEEELALFGCIM
ncbi:complement C3-like [Antennarius striatus]|uniref:complement C3-like n=1 Tax=Antennarius striatus TaxID=241820 RepID=UPI0035B37435